MGWKAGQLRLVATSRKMAKTSKAFTTSGALTCPIFSARLVQSRAKETLLAARNRPSWSSALYPFHSATIVCRVGGAAAWA